MNDAASTLLERLTTAAETGESSQMHEEEGEMAARLDEASRAMDEVEAQMETETDGAVVQESVRVASEAFERAVQTVQRSMISESLSRNRLTEVEDRETEFVRPRSLFDSPGHKWFGQMLSLFLWSRRVWGWKVESIKDSEWNGLQLFESSPHGVETTYRDLTWRLPEQPIWKTTSGIRERWKQLSFQQQVLAFVLLQRFDFMSAEMMDIVQPVALCRKMFVATNAQAMRGRGLLNPEERRLHAVDTVRQYGKIATILRWLFASVATADQEDQKKPRRKFFFRHFVSCVGC